MPGLCQINQVQWIAQEPREVGQKGPDHNCTLSHTLRYVSFHLILELVVYFGPLHDSLDQTLSSGHLRQLDAWPCYKKLDGGFRALGLVEDEIRYTRLPWRDMMKNGGRVCWRASERLYENYIALNSFSKATAKFSKPNTCPCSKCIVWLPRSLSLIDG